MNSVICAFRGIYITLKSERNFKIHVAALIAVVCLGLYLNLSVTRWGLIILSSGLVLASELFNTAVERLSDDASQGEHLQSIRNVKDISAAAVLLSTLTALVTGILVLFVPFVKKILFHL
jgi:diacylglycerol kinase